MYKETAGLMMYGQLGNDSILMKLSDIFEQIEHQAGRSRENFFGGQIYYDNSGRQVGRSGQDIFGNTLFYDANGRQVGRSSQTIMGRTITRLKDD